MNLLSYSQRKKVTNDFLQRIQPTDWPDFGWGSFYGDLLCNHQENLFHQEG